MVGCERNGFARIGNYLSLISGLICALFGMLLLRWVASFLYLGLLIIFTSLLQRMTYKTFASILTVLFSTSYMIFWWLMTSGLPMIFNLQYAGLIGSLFGIVGGAMSAFTARTLQKNGKVAG